MCYYDSIMRSIGVREIRQNASVHLRAVKAGEIVCITERGQPIAVLMSPGAAVGVGVRELIDALVELGLYPDLDAALTEGVRALTRQLRSRLVDEAVVAGYTEVAQEPDPWVEEASIRAVAQLPRW